MPDPEQGELFPDNAASPSATDPNPGPGIETNPDASGGNPGPQSSSGTDNPATTDDGPKSLHDVVTAALKGETPADPDDESEAGDEPADDKSGEKPGADPKGEKAAGADADKSKEPSNDGSGDAEPDDPTDEELSALKPKVQKRVKQLLAQRNDARREADDLRSDADGYRQVRQFMATNQLQDKEVAELFQLGADLKSGDPKRLTAFLDRVMPTIQGVLEATGRVVPTDLREKVDKGELTEDAAKQFARERFGRVAAEQKVKQVDQQVQQQTRTQLTTSIQSTVAAWEQQVRTTDPDFGMKADAMKRAAQAIVAERGLPDTPEKALQYAKDAYAEVNAWMARARPAPKRTQPAPASGSSAHRTGLAPQANSLEEIIKGALAAGNRR